MLTSANVLKFLCSAYELQHSNTQYSTVSDLISFGAELVEQCLTVVKLTAAHCLLSSDWLRLPKALLIHIISSHDLALPEDRVWQAVLCWAKHNASIALDKNSSALTDTEKKRIQEVLNGVTKHIRWMLIDSSLFAAEVEPVGVVPLEVVVARYKKAAMSGRQEEVKQRVQSLQGASYFEDSSILVADLTSCQQLLNDWYGKPNQMWLLLFRGSMHNFSSKAFHQFCDDHFPTFVIVKGVEGSVCGGFTDVAWTSPASSHGKFFPSQRAFLFTLINSQGIGATRLPIVKTRLAVLHHSSYGPVFGGGADLCLSDQCGSRAGSYSNLSHSYSSAALPSTILMANYHFLVSDYEVFTPCT